MKKNIALILISAIIILNTTSAFALKYEAPYESMEGDRLYDTMPAPVSLDTMANSLIGECDFISGDSFAVLKKSYYVSTYWDMEDGLIAIDKTQTDSAETFALKYTPSNGFKKGEVYAFRCKIKTEGLSGTAPLNILAAYDSNSKGLSVAQSDNGTKGITGSNDWYEMTQVLEIPEGTQYLNLQGYLNAETTGKVYFDDFELYKVALDPMESVLVSPNYKGLIYGDGFSDINLDVLLTEQEGFYALEDMTLEVSLTDSDDEVIYTSFADSLNSRMNFVFSSYGLNEEDYYIDVLLRDALTGNIVSQKKHTIRKRSEDYRPDAYVDENGHYIKNGAKTFIKRLYNHSGNGSSNYLTSAQDALNFGIDTVSNYGMWWALDNPITDTLDFMRSNDMTTHICLSSYWYSDRSNNMGKTLIPEQTDILPLFTQIAEDYRDDEVLEGYYVFDEADPVLEGEEMRWNNEILAEKDIDHPTFGVADKEFDNYGIYVKTTDILGVDPYPVTGKTDTEGNSLDDIAKVGRAVRQTKASFPNRPVYYVLQGFHFKDRGDSRSPTYAELRNMAWQAICEGAEGIDWYSYADMTMDETKTLEQWQSEVTALMSEIALYENVILSDENAPLCTLDEQYDWLNICAKRHNGKTYLFAVNNAYTSNVADISIEDFGNMTFGFEPLEVKLMELGGESVLSHKADLISLGFGNGTEVFETSVNERILYVYDSSAVINYTAKVSDEATLLIGGREMDTKGKITVRNSDFFTVTVIAEDGTTKTEYNYTVVKQAE